MSNRSVAPPHPRLASAACTVLVVLLLLLLVLQGVRPVLLGVANADNDGARSPLSSPRPRTSPVSGGQEHAADFCDDAHTLPPQEAFLFHPPRDVVLPPQSEFDVRLRPSVREAWRRVTTVSDEDGNRSNQTLGDLETHSSVVEARHRRNAHAADSQGRCRRRAAVLAVAVLAPDAVATFVESFVRGGSASRCHALHLFVTDRAAVMSSVSPLPGNVILEDFEAFSAAATAVMAATRPTAAPKGEEDAAVATVPPELVSQLGNRTGVEVTRLRALELWLRLLLREDRSPPYDLLLHVDARDVLFFDDPFPFLAALRREHGEYVFAVAEDLTWTEDLAQLNRYWIDAVGGSGLASSVATHAQIRSPGVGAQAAPQRRVPTINSGVYGGTPAAMLGLVELAAAAVALGPPGFGFDQGAFQTLFFGGFRVAKFAHRALVLNPALAPLRHQYPYPRGNLRIRWGLDGAHFNCAGRRYAVVHQLDRYHDEWKAAVEALRPPLPSECALDGAGPQFVVLPSLDQLTATPTAQLAGLAALECGAIHGNANVTILPASAGSCGLRVALVVASPHRVPSRLTAAALQPLALSFQRHARPRCDELHVLAPEPPRLVLDRELSAPSVVFHPWASAETSLDDDDGVALLLLLRWLREHGAGFGAVVVVRTPITLISSRWYALANETFRSLAAAAPEWLACVSGQASIGGDAHSPLAARIARLLRLDTTQVLAAARMAASRRGGKTLKPLPSVVSDVVAGTPGALRRFLALRERLRARDLHLARSVGAAAVHNAAFFFATVAARCPFRAFLLDHLSGPMRCTFDPLAPPPCDEAHGIRNCANETYALLCGLRQESACWNSLTRAFRVAWWRSPPGP